MNRSQKKLIFIFCLVDVIKNEHQNKLVNNVSLHRNLTKQKGYTSHSVHSYFHFLKICFSKSLFTSYSHTHSSVKPEHWNR